MEKKNIRKELPDISNKVVTLRDPQKSKLDEIRSYFGWSARRASSFILAHNLELDSVVHTSRLIFAKDLKHKSNTTNLFIPMTSKQINIANAIANAKNYDFTHLFKMEVDRFYEEYKPKNFCVDFDKNELTKKFQDN